MLEDKCYWRKRCGGDEGDGLHRGRSAIFKRADKTGTRNIVTTESKLGIWGETLQGEGIASTKTLRQKPAGTLKEHESEWE